ncbi:MAG: hypothetical protein K5856_01075 [Bacteroidaceae bacterium]|nr:hypothetical protein [Bacteroidaceae bacterium]
MVVNISVYSKESSNLTAVSGRKPVIIIESKKKRLELLQDEYPDAMIIDVTHLAKDKFVEFSPLYPHGGIPVPFSTPIEAASVEGIWQGLKVFEHAGVDATLFQNRKMKNMKHAIGKCGKYLGHKKGYHGNEVLDEITA